MYIPLEAIYIVVAILVATALVYLIFTLNNVNKFVKNASDLLDSNKYSINTSIKKLPAIVDNLSDVSESVKDISDVATDITADIIVKKESLSSNVELISDVVGIVKNTLIKK